MDTWDAEFPEGANIIRQLYRIIVIKATTLMIACGLLY